MLAPCTSFEAVRLTQRPFSQGERDRMRGESLSSFRHQASRCAMHLRGNDAHRDFCPYCVRFYSITFDSSQSTASSSCTRRTNRFPPLREYTRACVPVSAVSAAPKSKTRIPFAGLAETAFASNCPASAAKVTAAGDELESKRPSKYHMSGVGLRKTPISSPLHWTTRSALTSPTCEFYGLAPYGLFSLMRPQDIAATPRNVTLRGPMPGQK